MTSFKGKNDASKIDEEIERLGNKKSEILADAAARHKKLKEAVAEFVLETGITSGKDLKLTVTAEDTLVKVVLHGEMKAGREQARKLGRTLSALLDNKKLTHNSSETVTPYTRTETIYVPSNIEITGPGAPSAFPEEQNIQDEFVDVVLAIDVRAVEKHLLGKTSNRRNR
jgi:hypothetical protein